MPLVVRVLREMQCPLEGDCAYLVMQTVLNVISLVIRPSVVSVTWVPSLIPCTALQLVLIHAQVVNMVTPMVELILFVLVAMKHAPVAQEMPSPSVQRAMQVGTP